jgi:hypothetical protein
MTDATSDAQARRLRISAVRFNPQDPETKPRVQTYELT